ncbi:MAG: GtrA family protein [Bacteroidales bacterium]
MSKLTRSILIFGKAQVSALIGGLVDYGIMIFFTEVFNVHYIISIAIGGFVGAIVNFGINKGWTFHSNSVPYKHPVWRQIGRFTIVVLNSIILKSSGTYFITSLFKLDYKISRIIVDLIVSFAFNYNLQKFWVFKKRQKL